MRIAAAQTLLLALAFASAALLLAGSAVPAAQALARATTERPDDRSGPQIHLVYAVPSDGVDSQLDTNGTLADSIAVFEQWMREQTGGRQLRLDTYQGEPDITFIRLPFTAQQITNINPNELTLFRGAVGGAGLTDSTKLYGVYYDGVSNAATCGRGGNMLGVVYLRANAFANCDPLPFRHPGQTAAYHEFIMVHELLHGLGFAPSCGSHYAGDSHVSEPQDVMYGSTLGNSQLLDVGHDDYFQAHIPGCLDLDNSLYLAPPPPGQATGATAVAGDGRATVSFTAASGATGYRVTSTPGGISATGPASPITVTGLANGTAYTFVVTALNGTEPGTASPPTGAVTPFGPPGPPTNVFASAGDGQATVTFTLPAQNGGSAIAYYTGTASPGGRSASGTGSPITVAGLDNGTGYTFTVTATSSLGTSAASSPSSAVVPLGPERKHDDPPPEQPRADVPELVPAPQPRRPPVPAH